MVKIPKVILLIEFSRESGRVMLVETELPARQITETLGFEDMQHVGRYFRAGKGLSPLACRKKHGRKRAG